TVARALAQQTLSSDIPAAPRCDAPSIDAGPAPSGRLASTLPTDEPIFREIVEEFVEHLHQELGKLRAALAARDVQAIAATAHGLKGSCGSAGFAVMAEPFRQIEASLKLGQWDEIEQQLAQIDAMAERIVLAEPEQLAPMHS
ncbi:MAG: Hpt domain-containing protein, partial [Planctomycetales bacterium]|nr:Hpt domain-containing protein [Planctomycetales bacterium]